MALRIIDTQDSIIEQPPWTVLWLDLNLREGSQ